MENPRRTPPEELRRQAASKLVLAETARADGDLAEASRFTVYAAGLEMEAFATFSKHDHKERRRSGMAALRLYKQLADHYHVVTFGSLVLEILDGHLSREARQEIKAGVKESRDHLPENPIPSAQNL